MPVPSLKCETVDPLHCGEGCEAVLQSEDPIEARYHKLMEEYIAQGEQLDTQMARLFNATAASLGSTFTAPGRRITRTREVISAWDPPKYDPMHDSNAFKRDYLLSNFFKRWLTFEEYEDQKLLIDKTAIEFLLTNSEGLELNYAEKLLDPEFKELITHMRSICTRVLDHVHLSDVYKNAKHGPNSTKDIPLENAYLHIKDRVIRGTRHSLQQFHHYLQYDHILRSHLVEEDDEVRAFVNGLVIPDHWVVDSTDQLSVPKTFKSRRGMAPEVTVPSFFGQGWGNSLATALRAELGIDLSTQPDVHRKLAMLGSLYPECGIATDDWKGASDRNWILLCNLVIPDSHMRFLMNCCRCSYTTVKVVGFPSVLADLGLSNKQFQTLLRRHGNTIVKTEWFEGKRGIPEYTVRCRTNMISTMGNAITFPLQTLLFYAFHSACTSMAARRLYNEDDVSTHVYKEDFYVSAFGDDGILPSFAKLEVIKFAPMIGWKLNLEKSFFEGPFRESCGGDYFLGEYCRPVMIQRPSLLKPRKYDFNESYRKENLRTLQAWSYIAANAVCETLDSLNYSYDTIHIDRWLEQFHTDFNLGKICVVPPYYPDGSGLRVNWDFEYMKDDPCFRAWYHLDFKLPLDPDVYHLVKWDHKNKGYSFYALESKPRTFTPFSEFSYYHDVLRAAPPTDARHRVSFFDLTVKQQARLKSDGTIPIKECRIRKEKQYCLSWRYWSDSPR